VQLLKEINLQQKVFKMLLFLMLTFFVAVATMQYLQDLPGLISNQYSLSSGDYFYFFYLPTFRLPILQGMLLST